MDRVPEGTRLLLLPITGGIAGELALTIQKATLTADFSKVPVDLNPEIHRLLIREARDEYAQLLHKIADPANRPLVFHCSHGVHRTGTATAILLSALGVPWETVREDYLLSNECREEEVDRRLAELRAQAARNQDISPDEVDMRNMNAFYRLEGDYIDASLDEVIQEFGSMDAFLREGLGLTDDELMRLRDTMLENGANSDGNAESGES